MLVDRERRFKTEGDIMPRYESPYDPSTMPRNLEHVLYEKKGHVAYVTLNRPEVRNALHSYAYAEMRSCWRDIGLDPDIYVGIVTGAGQAFCAGPRRQVPGASTRRRASARRTRTRTIRCSIGAAADSRRTSTSKSR